MPALLEPDYLTPPYFEEYRYAVKRAKEKGMLMWLYDEGGWPSGGACGKVLTKHPEYARQSLDARKKSFSKGDIYTAAEDTAVAFLDDGTRIEDGYIFEADCNVTEYFARVSFFETPGLPDFPDMTRREATDVFLKETHEAYKPYLQEYFGDVLLAVFSDEPTAPRLIPFRTEIEELFMKENGYSIRPFLPELYGKAPLTEKGAAARIAWFDLCSRLFCENYLLAEKEWSNKHGMVFSGHMSGEHLEIIWKQEIGIMGFFRGMRLRLRRR